MRFGAMAMVGIAVLVSVSCLGRNPPGERLDELLETYDDLGRETIDPIVPGVLSLTFDDGPGPYTKGIVDALQKHGVAATFFVVGANIPGNRDVITYAHEHGQQVASHSYNHEPQPSLTEAEFKYRLLAVERNIRDVDQGRLFFRFPYGAAGEEQLRWLSEVQVDGHPYKPVGWHIDSQDFDFDRLYPGGEHSDVIVSDSRAKASCGGQKNPFQDDMLGWTQFIARKARGGVMLFHDTKRITHDRMPAILDAFADPAAYWASLPEAKRVAYAKYYACTETDPMFRFTFGPLWGGAYPSLQD